ncbi:MAG: hypothetical protein AAGG75_09345 [Bacteroidota bacterium]
MPLKYLLLSFCCTAASLLLAQDIEVPMLPVVQTEENLLRLVPLGMYYDDDGKLTFQLGDRSSQELDDVTTYLFEAKSQLPDFYLIRSAVELIIDKELRLEDVEMVQEELKRLGCLMVFYAVNSGIRSRIKNIWSTGFYCKLPSTDQRRIAKYYAAKGLPVKANEQLRDRVFEKKRKQRQQDPQAQDDEVPSDIPPPPSVPPPPPPLPEQPKVYNDSIAAAYPEFRAYPLFIIHYSRNDLRTIDTNAYAIYYH